MAASHLWCQDPICPLPDNSTALNATNKRQILEVLGTLLYYPRGINSTLLTAIGELATEQSVCTKTTMATLTQLLNYCTTNPDATLRFTASDMILAVKSDASYLSVIKAHSRAAGYFFLTNSPAHPTDALKLNGAVHPLCHIMHEVLSSTAEAELGALFHNGKEACPSELPLRKWALHNPQCPWQLTTIQSVAALPPTPSNKKGQKQLTCVSTGSAIVFVRASLQSTGAKAKLIMQTISPNIIQPRIIKPFAPHACNPLPILHEITLSVLPTQHLHRLPCQKHPVPIFSHALQWPLVRVCCYPRGTR